MGESCKLNNLLDSMLDLTTFEYLADHESAISMLSIN